MSVCEPRTTAPPRRLIDADEVARKLGVSRRQVFRLADSGGIPAGVHLGRLRRWCEAEIDKFIEGGCRPPRGR